jgi:hypothetical protein
LRHELQSRLDSLSCEKSLGDLVDGAQACLLATPGRRISDEGPDHSPTSPTSAQKRGQADIDGEQFSAPSSAFEL